MKTEQKYLWLDKDEHFKGIVTDLEALHRDANYNTTDRLFELGRELELEVTVTAVLKNPVFRESDTIKREAYRTPFENRD
jgi:hypothetical protein